MVNSCLETEAAMAEEGGGGVDRQRRVDAGIGNIHCTGQTCLEERKSSYSRYKESQ